MLQIGRQRREGLPAGRNPGNANSAAYSPVPLSLILAAEHAPGIPRHSQPQPIVTALDSAATLGGLSFCINQMQYTGTNHGRLCFGYVESNP